MHQWEALPQVDKENESTEDAPAANRLARQSSRLFAERQDTD